MEASREELDSLADSVARATVDQLERERRYRRRLTITRVLIVLVLVVSLAVPAVGVVVAGFTTAYAFVYRRYLGMSWVLLPAFFVVLSAVALVIAALSDHPLGGVTIIGR